MNNLKTYLKNGEGLDETSFEEVNMKTNK